MQEFLEVNTVENNFVVHPSCLLSSQYDGCPVPLLSLRSRSAPQLQILRALLPLSHLLKSKSIQACLSGKRLSYISSTSHPQCPSCCPTPTPAVAPASTGKIAPVIQRASFPARNLTQAPATVSEIRACKAL